MLGALVGDIVGSRFEWHNCKSKDFQLFQHHCEVTDDSIMTLAIAKAFLECHEDYSNLSDQAIKWMKIFGRAYPHAGYGTRFNTWLYSDSSEPYQSFGNGAAMRVSPCAMVAKNLDELKELSYKVTAVTHNHPEGIKGAEAIAVSTYLAFHGSNVSEIKEHIVKNYYPLDFTIDEIRPTYDFDETCQGSTPQALEAFFESVSFEDAIRNAISVGGDSDTIGAMTGSIAEAYYGIPDNIRVSALTNLDPYLLNTFNEFEAKFGSVLNAH